MERTQTRDEVDEINGLFVDGTGMELFDRDLQRIFLLIKRFSFDEVYTATIIAISRYYTGGSAWSLKYVVDKIGGICYNRRKAREEDGDIQST